MKGLISGFVRGRHAVTGNKMIIHIEGVTSRVDARKIVGKKVTWVAPGKNKTTINGVITVPHGNKGYVRALFERGMPGQSITTNVEIKE